MGALSHTSAISYRQSGESHAERGMQAAAAELRGCCVLCMLCAVCLVRWVAARSLRNTRPHIDFSASFGLGRCQPGWF
jgi:hypothetical protein